MKEKILELREKGKSYSDIAKSLDCAKSTVAYHCNDLIKSKVLVKQKRERKKK